MFITLWLLSFIAEVEFFVENFGRLVYICPESNFYVYFSRHRWLAFPCWSNYMNDVERYLNENNMVWCKYICIYYVVNVVGHYKLNWIHLLDLVYQVGIAMSRSEHGTPLTMPLLIESASNEILALFSRPHGIFEAETVIYKPHRWLLFSENLIQKAIAWWNLLQFFLQRAQIKLDSFSTTGGTCTSGFPLSCHAILFLKFSLRFLNASAFHSI